MVLGKNIEVITVSERGYNLDQAVNKLTSEGWKILSAPILSYSRAGLNQVGGCASFHENNDNSTWIQQLYRDKDILIKEQVKEREFESDFKVCVDLLTAYQGVKSMAELVRLQQDTYNQHKVLRKRKLEFDKK